MGCMKAGYILLAPMLSLPLATARQMCSVDRLAYLLPASSRGLDQSMQGRKKSRKHSLFQSDFIEKETYKNHVQKKLTKHVQKIHSGIYSSAYTVFYRLGHPSPLPDSSLFCDSPPP